MIWYNIIHNWLRLINLSGILESYKSKRGNDNERNSELEEGKPLITDIENENMIYGFKGKNAFPYNHRKK